MNNTCFLEQIFKTGNMDSDLITRQYFLDLNAKFMQEKSLNPKLKQSEIAKQLNLSTSTIQRSTKEINMKSPNRYQNSNEKRQKISDDKGDPLISNDLKDTSKESVKSNRRSKNVLKGGYIQENVDINEHYLDESLRNNDS